jgi:hypothetical protein
MPAMGAGYFSDFEGLAGSPDGTILTGQDAYYIPGGTDSVDWHVFTYAGNALGLPQNPDGGLQFVGGLGPGSPTFARAQRDVEYPNSGQVVIQYDFAGAWLGNGDGANNLGSFSAQPYPGAATYIHLMSWVDPIVPTNYNAFYLAYDASGTAHSQPGMSPGAAWESLDLYHWYRSYTVLDFESNRIVEVGIKDLDTGDESVFNPADWYMEGGEAGGLGLPTGFRFFAGGGVYGNSLGFDNMAIVPTPGVLALLGIGALAGLRRRR